MPGFPVLQNAPSTRTSSQTQGNSREFPEWSTKHPLFSLEISGNAKCAAAGDPLGFLFVCRKSICRPNRQGPVRFLQNFIMTYGHAKTHTHRCELAFVTCVSASGSAARQSRAQCRAGEFRCKTLLFLFSASTLKSPEPERQPRTTSKLGRPANRRHSSGAKSRSATSHTDDEDATQPTTGVEL